MARPFLICCLALAAWSLSAEARAGEFYTCRLAGGRIEMRDTPCPANARTLSARDVPEMSIPGEPPGAGSRAAAGPGRVDVIPAASVPAASVPASRGADPSLARPRAPSPVKAEAFVDPDWDPGFIATMLLRARFAGVLSSLHNLRNAAMMHEAEIGAWPTRAEDMGLDGSTMQTNEIANVRFFGDGTILATLKPGFGKGKFVALQPVEELGGAQLGWKCRANFPKEFLGGSFGAGCESRAIHLP